MYSRYTPNASGGFDRQQLPDEADLRAAQGRAPPGIGDQGLEPGNQTSAERGESALPPAGTRSRVQRPAGGRSVRPPVPRTPGIHPPPPPPPPVFGSLLGPEGLLRQLLPHGLDTEDLLVLAVLLLSMKQDGASPTELLIAAGLYFWL